MKAIIDFNQSVANPSTLVVHQTRGAASVDSDASARREGLQEQSRSELLFGGAKFSSSVKRFLFCPHLFPHLKRMPSTGPLNAFPFHLSC